jgi:hypothetical protein
LSHLNLKASAFAIALIALTFELAPFQASAITVEVAQKCSPPREPGNPAAGSAKGTAQSARAYFNKCVANSGNMDGEEKKGQK